MDQQKQKQEQEPKQGGAWETGDIICDIPASVCLKLKQSRRIYGRTVWAGGWWHVSNLCHLNKIQTTQELLPTRTCMCVCMSEWVADFG